MHRRTMLGSILGVSLLPRKLFGSEKKEQWWTEEWRWYAGHKVKFITWPDDRYIHIYDPEGCPADRQSWYSMCVPTFVWREFYSSIDEAVEACYEQAAEAKPNPIEDPRITVIQIQEHPEIIGLATNSKRWSIPYPMSHHGHEVERQMRKRNDARKASSSAR